MGWRERLDRRWYPGFEDEWDARAFRARILERLRPGDRVLDIGAGRGATPHMDFHGLAAEVTGTDVDGEVLSNPQLHRAVHTPEGRLDALEPDYFDLVVSKDVLEHVQAPEPFFAELARVLKPGGLFMAKTPNKGHYVPTIARLTPTSFHKSFNKRRGREEVDTFPTVYGANTRRDLERLAASAGLEVAEIAFQEGRPEYLRSNPAFYLAGFVYERAVNALGLDRLKAVLYVTLRKPD